MKRRLPALIVVLTMGLAGTALAQVNSREGGALPFQFNDVEYARISETAGNLGIGTTNPVAKLTVAGNVSVTGMIDVGHTTLACAAAISGSIRYETTSDTLQICTSTGWKSLVSGTIASGGSTSAASSTGAIQFNSDNSFAGDTSNLFWDDANNRLGIGTTSPGYSLDVSGPARLVSYTGILGTPLGQSPLAIGSESTFNSQDGNGLFNIVAGGYQPVGGGGYVYTNTRGASRISLGDGAIYLYAGGSNGQGVAGTAIAWIQMAQMVSNTEVWFSPRGSSSDFYINSVGNIGMGTTSPNAKLTVSSSMSFVGTASNTIFFGANGVAPPGAASAGEKIQLWGTSGSAGAGDYALGIESGTMWFNSGGAYKWYVNASQKMVMDSSGNLGIGTNSPNAKLHVAGAISATAEITAGLGGYGQFRAVSGNYGSFIRNDGSDTYLLLTASGDPQGTWNSLRPFRINNAGGDVFLDDGTLTVQASTNRVGIGTTLPQAKLDVAGNVSATGGVSVTGNVQATTYLHNSDRRLKDDIRPISNTLSIIEKLQGTHYRWKKDHTPSYGLIAQDVEKILPELGPQGEGMKSVDYDQLTPILIEGIKQLNAEKNALVSRTDWLERELKATNDNNAKVLHDVERRLIRLEATGRGD